VAGAIGWLGAGVLGAQGARGVAPAPATHPATPPAAAASAQVSSGLVAWEWWNDADVKKQVGLTDDKVKRIDGFYRQRSTQLRALADEQDKQRKILDQMTSQRVVDESQYNLQVAMEESLRFELSKSRLMMLYHMYRELTPDEYNKFLVVLDKRRTDASRGRSSGPGR